MTVVVEDVMVEDVMEDVDLLLTSPRWSASRWMVSATGAP